MAISCICIHHELNLNVNYYFVIYSIYIIMYNIIIISYSDIYSKHSMGIATEIKSTTNFIDPCFGNTSFGCNVTAAILKF